MNIRQATKISALMVSNALAALFNRPSEPAILMYHSFDTTGWKHGVDPEELKRQLEYLVATRTVVSLYDIVAWVKGEKGLPNNAVAITIDDGYEDTYSVFFPLAKRYQLPFTLFLTTDLSPMPKLGNLPRPTMEQLREMHDSGLMTLGLHGHSHLNFPEVLEKNLEKQEIDDSRTFIEKHFGQKVDLVAYPAGRQNANVVRKVKESGFVAAFVASLGVVDVVDDVFLLKRIVVDRSTSFVLFKQRLGSGFAFNVRLVRILKCVGNHINKIVGIIKKWFRGDNPLVVSLPQTHWDAQFNRGYWDFLLAEPPNIQYIASYIIEHYADRNPVILDVGCGNGAIPKLLNEGGITFEYVGTDISETALEQARKHFPQGQFIHTPMEQPPQLDLDFDIVIFCEVLLYGDARKVIEVHRPFIKEDTLVVISLYKNWRTWIIWRQINGLFDFSKTKELSSNDWKSSWKVKMGHLRNQ